MIRYSTFFVIKIKKKLIIKRIGGENMSFFKKFSENMKIKKYYSEQINNGKSYIGSIMDKFILGTLISVLILVYLYVKTQSVLASTVVAVLFTIMYSVFLYRINKKKTNKGIKSINQKLVKEEVYKTLVDQDLEEYLEYIQKVLENYKINKIKILNDRQISMIGQLNGELIGIKCYQYSEDHKVDVSNVREFFLKLKSQNIRKGIVITTSSFSEDVKVFFDKLDKYVDIKLVDIEKIINLISETELYPKKSEIEKIILQEINDNKTKARNESKKIVSKDNTKKCIMFGITLILFSRITPYTRYYITVAYILILLGLVPIIKSTVNFILLKDDEENDEKNSFIW